MSSGLSSGLLVSATKLYIDHDVARQIADLLRSRGYDVATTRERGLEKARDGEQLLVAAQEERVLLTHNGADFLLLNDAWLRWSQAWQVTPRHVGILVIPQRPRLSPVQAVEEVHRFLTLGQSMVNRLYQWRAGSGWQHRQ